MAQPRSPRNEDKYALFLEQAKAARALGAESFQACIGDDSFTISWPSHEERDRVPAIGSGLPVGGYGGYEYRKVGF